METHKQLKKKNQQLAKLERQLALVKIKQRKADTRRKIEFGGLVIKANLHHYPKAIILGALIDAAEALAQEPGKKALFQSKGEAAFMDYDKKNPKERTKQSE